MTKILSGKQLSQNLQDELQQKVQKYFPNKDKYIAILFFGENSASKTYVKLKKKFAKNIGLHVEVFGQEDDKNTDFCEDLNIYKNQEYDSVVKIVELIQFLNFDKDCVWILVQLPLPDEFMKYKSQILSAISPKKDIDWLWGTLFGLSSIDLIDFVPATPKSVLYLLEKYDLWDMKGKTIAILWQSNLVWKPLTLELIKRWATVYSTNHYNDQNKIKNICKKSDYIISCTGQIHLIDESYLREDQSQIIVDVGYWYKDGKPVGDVQFEKIKNKVFAYTPVPGGVWPLTVACLFDNIFVLKNIKPYILA